MTIKDGQYVTLNLFQGLMKDPYRVVAMDI